MTIDASKYQNSDTRQLAIDLNVMFGGAGSNIQMSPRIIYLPDATLPNPLVYEIPAGTISFSVVNTSDTEDITIGVNTIKPQGIFSFNAQNGYFGAQTVTITGAASAEIAHTTPTPIV